MLSEMFKGVKGWNVQSQKSCWACPSPRAHSRLVWIGLGAYAQDSYHCMTLIAAYVPQRKACSFAGRSQILLKKIPGSWLKCNVKPVLRHTYRHNLAISMSLYARYCQTNFSGLSLRNKCPLAFRVIKIAYTALLIHISAYDYDPALNMQTVLLCCWLQQGEQVIQGFAFYTMINRNPHVCVAVVWTFSSCVALPEMVDSINIVDGIFHLYGRCHFTGGKLRIRHLPKVTFVSCG